jgi:hypothetical protein
MPRDLREEEADFAEPFMPREAVMTPSEVVIQVRG